MRDRVYEFWSVSFLHGSKDRKAPTLPLSCSDGWCGELYLQVTREVQEGP